MTFENGLCILKALLKSLKTCQTINYEIDVITRNLSFQNFFFGGGGGRGIVIFLVQKWAIRAHLQIQ